MALTTLATAVNAEESAADQSVVYLLDAQVKLDARYEIKVEDEKAPPSVVRITSAAFGADDWGLLTASLGGGTDGPRALSCAVMCLLLDAKGAIVAAASAPIDAPKGGKLIDELTLRFGLPKEESSRIKSARIAIVPTNHGARLRSGQAAGMEDREPTLLADSEERAFREGDTLAIKIDTIRWVPRLYRNHYVGDGVVVYDYEGWLKEISYHLLSLGFYEGGGYLLIQEKHGTEFRVDSPPVVSPKRDRLVTANADLEAGYDPNRIQIFRIVKLGLELEFEHEPDRWGPVSPEWASDTVIHYKRKYPASPDGAARVSDEWFEIRLEGGKWRLIGAP